MPHGNGNPAVTEILTPHDSDAAVELANGLWRKQILPMKSIKYTARDGSQRNIDFNREYLADLQKSFQAKAFDQVAAQLAPANNSHSNDVRDTGGELIATELAADGLYGVFKLNDKGNEVVRANPKVGVSARIIENLSRSDGQQFSRAMQHVLLTLDPQIPGMKPWEAAEDLTLSSGKPDVVIDLSHTDYTEETVVETKSAAEAVTLSREQADGLAALLAERAAAQTAAQTAATELANAEGDAETGESAEVDLANNEVFSALREEVELANSRVIEMNRQMAATQLAAEVEKLAHQGIAPAIIEAAKPLLAAQPGAVELSNGITQVDLGKAVRDLLQTVVDLDKQGVAVVQLGREDGYLLTGEEADPIREKRQSVLNAWSEAYGK